MSQYCKTRPDIDYPGPWIYKIIGADEEALRRLVASLLGERPHTLTLSGRSAGGKYTSLRLEVTVDDEADRLALFEALSVHPAVKVVL